MLSPTAPTSQPDVSAANVEAAPSNQNVGTTEAPAVPASGISRKRLWQLEMMAQGKCSLCGQPRVTKNHCAACALKARERARARYRRAHGIPVDAPLRKSGRPKQTGSLNSQLPGSQLSQP